MKKYIFCLLAILLGMDTGAYCQQYDNMLEKTITVAYQKAYPACVKLFAYDTVAKQQAGGQFSGVVVSKDGYILTAAHVAAPGIVYKVTFPDGKDCLAVGLGKIEFAEDKTRPDAAMLKIITSGNWPYVLMANSDELKIYEPCISLSYPESLYQPKPTLRFGYVSAIKNERGFIKSTCIMEPGDSGGPLFDYMGRLIGIHSAIEIAEADNYDVPVNTYLKYWDALKKPTVYTALPAVINKIPNDLLRKSIVAVPGLKNNEIFKSIKFAHNSNCYFIKSTLDGKDQMVTGTLFSLKGSNFKEKLISVFVSKSSLVGTHPVIIDKNAQVINAKVIARNKSNDLVLIAPATQIAGGIEYAKQISDSLAIMAGTFLVSARPDSAGGISISGSSIFNLPKMSSSAFLGVGFKSKAAPLKISYVFPNLNKSIYSLSIGDEIIMINKDSLSNFDGFIKEINHYWPGDTVQLTIQHAGQSLKENIVLDTIPQRHFNHPAEKFAGGKSARRDGFNGVFTHDAIIQPYQCGSPVFDLTGHFYGLNIARFSRTSTIALPATTIYNFIDTSLNNSKIIKELNNHNEY
jgi:serine protease Do